MNDTVTLISAGLGIVLPFLITVIKQAHFKTIYNALIAIVVSAGAGALTAWGGGNFTGTDVVGAISIIYGEAQVVYNTFFNIAPFNTWEEKLNELTTVKQSEE